MYRLLFIRLCWLLFVFCCNQKLTKAQDQTNAAFSEFPGKMFSSLSEKSFEIEKKIDKATENYLSKLLKQELKLKKKLWEKDTALAKQLFEGVEEKYASLKNAPTVIGKYTGAYNGHLDSMTTALKFLSAENLSSPQVQQTLSRFSSLQTKINQAETIKRFLNERKKLLKENLAKFGMLKKLKGFSKEAYYYSAQIREYKAIWNDPSKLEKKLMEWVLKSDKFKDFFRNSSQLGSLFVIPGSIGASTASLQGLQTRTSIQQAIVSRFGSASDVQRMISENLQDAQAQLNQLKNKLSQYGNGSAGNSGGSNIDVPDGFKPNTQKTKTFLQRLEYGANIQTQKARSYCPVTSDIGLSLGYKLNDNSSLGVGVSYKVGFGKGWNNVRFTSEGMGLRSYLDYKIKRTLYISGGYEQNYLSAFYSINQLKNFSAWQSSGLIGLSKKYKVSKKLKGDIRLLWDFLSYQQVPKTQPVLFRIGYSLK